MTAWLISFLVHSSLWLGLAWFLTLLFTSMHARTREAIWYTAIVASLLVPSIHALAPASFASLWTLPIPSALLSSSGSDQGAVNFVASRFAESRESWQGYALLAWIAISGAFLLFYVARLSMLRRVLSPSEIGGASRAAVVLTWLSQRAGLRRPPRLTESESLSSPIALGFGMRAEICVPTRALHELDNEQFRAMLGHEVAHLLRRDPLRLGALHLLQAVFFFQPLYRIAGCELQRAAEEQCDAWAASFIEDRLAVASCLTVVAGWLLPQHRQFPVVGMTRGRSSLTRRVNRLMDAQITIGSRGKLWRVLGSTSALLVAPWLAPSLAPDGEFQSDLYVDTQPVNAEAVYEVPDYLPEGENHDRDGGENRRATGGEHNDEHGEEVAHGNVAENGREHNEEQH